MADLTNLRILGMGNPLLDISAVVGQDELDAWQVECPCQILAEEKHAPLYAKLSSKYPVEYIAGGATQNSIRVAQWVAGTKGSTAYVGCVGQDAFGEQLEKAATADGVLVKYMKQTAEPTGTCAVLVKDGERSLIANLAAANKYDKSHFDTPEIQALLEAAKIVYMAGFFLTVSPPTILAVGEHCAKNGKTVCMNLSAPFIIQVPPLKEALDKSLYYVDFLFGNETEAATYGETAGWGKDVAEIALKLAALPKASGTRPRVVIFTQGSDATLVACGGVVSAFPVPKLPKEQLVDTNGAGDAFVGGFLAKLALGCDLATCVNAGNYAARQIIQVSGCKIPSFPAAC